jgi:putative membrane protein
MHWNDGWHDGAGPWWWLVMMFVMILFWGGVAFAIVMAIRHGVGTTRAPEEPRRPSAEDILGERFARGEIDAEEYHQRLEALRVGKRPG